MEKEKNLIVTSTFYSVIQKTVIAQFPYNAECKFNPPYIYHTKSIVHLNLLKVYIVSGRHVCTHTSEVLKSTALKGELQAVSPLRLFT